MTTDEVKEVEIIFHLRDGRRLYAVTDKEEVIDCIATNTTFSPVIGEFSPEEREFTELISNEKK